MTAHLLEHPTLDDDAWDADTAEQHKTIAACIVGTCIISNETMYGTGSVWSLPKDLNAPPEMKADLDDPIESPVIKALPQTSPAALLYAGVPGIKAEVRILSLEDGSTVDSQVWDQGFAPTNHGVYGRFAAFSFASRPRDDGTDSDPFIQLIAADEGTLKLASPRRLVFPTYMVPVYINDAGDLIALRESFRITNTTEISLFRANPGVTDETNPAPTFSTTLPTIPGSLPHCDFITCTSTLHVPGKNQIVISLNQSILGGSHDYPSAIWCVDASTCQIRWNAVVRFEVKEMVANVSSNLLVIVGVTGAVSVVNLSTGSSVIKGEQMSIKDASSLVDSSEGSIDAATAAALKAAAPAFSLDTKTEVLDVTVSPSGAIVALTRDSATSRASVTVIPLSAFVATGFDSSVSGVSIIAAPDSFAIPTGPVPPGRWGLAKVVASDEAAVISAKGVRSMVVARWKIYGGWHHSKVFLIQHGQNRASLQGPTWTEYAFPLPHPSPPLTSNLSDFKNFVHIIVEVKPTEIYNLGAQAHVKVSFDMAQYTVKYIMNATSETCYPAPNPQCAGSTRPPGLTNMDQDVTPDQAIQPH
ncbi:hypothetical protein HDU67_001832 [Dinochytrium kinnereticum]|nr:hypothetical protein HDU67_001832 [Dinochytrium kinnereticum]